MNTKKITRTVVVLATLLALALAGCAHTQVAVKTEPDPFVTEAEELTLLDLVSCKGICVETDGMAADTVVNGERRPIGTIWRFEQDHLYVRLTIGDSGKEWVSTHELTKGFWRFSFFLDESRLEHSWVLFSIWSPTEGWVRSEIGLKSGGTIVSPPDGVR